MNGCPPSRRSLGRIESPSAFPQESEENHAPRCAGQVIILFERIKRLETLSHLNQLEIPLSNFLGDAKSWPIPPGKRT